MTTFKVYPNSKAVAFLSSKLRFTEKGQLLILTIRERHKKGLCVGCSEYFGFPIYFHTKRLLGDRYTIVNEGQHLESCPLFTQVNQDHEALLPRHQESGKVKLVTKIHLIAQLAEEQTHSPGKTHQKSNASIKQASKDSSLNTVIKSLIEQSFLHYSDHKKLAVPPKFLPISLVKKPASSIQVDKSQTLADISVFGMKGLVAAQQYMQNHRFEKIRPCRVVWFTFDQMNAVESGVEVIIGEKVWQLPIIKTPLYQYPNTKGPRLGVAILTVDITTKKNIVDRFWTHPIVCHSLPVPVDSHYERLLAGVLNEFCRRRLICSWYKPQLGQFYKGTYLIPDFIVKKKLAVSDVYSCKIIVELMGHAFDKELYDERKNRTLPLMRAAYHCKTVSIDINRPEQLDVKSTEVVESIYRQIERVFNSIKCHND